MAQAGAGSLEESVGSPPAVFALKPEISPCGESLRAW
jgi:hypothetical protein